MTFLTLDDKNECIGYYHNGNLFFGQEPNFSLTRTWKHHPYLKNKNIKYANLFVDGKDFAEICPEDLKEEWDALTLKAKAFIRTFVEAKVSLKENCFYDLVPKQFLISYSDIKCRIIDHVFSSVKEPDDYQFRCDLEKLLINIRYNKLNLNFEKLKELQHEPRARDFITKYNQKENSIIYNQFHSKTGRLTTEENSFPILTMNKNYRSVIQPSNDFFIDIDYNAAELRTFLALSGIKQPNIDIHEWNMKQFNFPDRDSAKNEFISWMYGKKNIKEQEFKKYYDVDLIKNKYWDGNYVTNHYGKKIESDEFHSVNYAIQSSTAGLALRQAIKVNKLLENCKSKIIAIIHDNIIVDVCKEEKHLIKQMISTYTETEFGKFMSSVKIGKDLTDMRKLV